MVNIGPLTAEIGSVREFGAPEQISTDFASWLPYCTDIAHWRSTKLCTMFGRLLGWYTIYTFFGALAPNGICQLQNSLCVQVLRSPILAALLHGTRAAAVSQTLWRGMELWNFRCGRHLYSAGRPSRWALAHIVVFFFFLSFFLA